MLKIIFMLVFFPIITFQINIINLWINIIIILFLSVFLIITLYLPTLSITPIISTNIFFLDSLSTPLIILTLWTIALIFLARFNVVFNNISPHIFSINLLILNYLLFLVFTLNNFLTFYISFEASLIPTLILIIGWGYQPERLQAGLYLILYTIVASLPLLLRIIRIYKTNSSLFILSSIELPLKHFINIWWILSILAFLVKIPLYSTHLWLPKAHVEAPVAGSIILAGILLKLGSYGLLRIASPFWWVSSYSLLSVVFSTIRIVGAIVTAIICIRQSDLKALIAYSSIGHMGLIIAGFMSGTTWGWEAALTIIIAHGLCSSALFAIANIIYETTQSRSIILNKGMLAIFPAITLWWFVLAAANMGAPPSLNIIREILLITRIIRLSIYFIPALLIGSFIAGTYSLIIYTSTQHGNPPKYINSIKILSSRNHVIIILHALPLVFIVFKIDLCLSWII